MSEQTSFGQSEREPCTFDTVFGAECDEIIERRMFLGNPTKGSGEHAEFRQETLQNLTGLALSGGGIRSATFCLGLLQGLRNKGLIQAFDYLSTVSGGGFVGGWWSAWLARDPRFEVVDFIDQDGVIALLAGNDYLKPATPATEPFARYLMWRFEHPHEVTTATDTAMKAAAAKAAADEAERAAVDARAAADEAERVAKDTSVVEPSTAKSGKDAESASKAADAARQAAESASKAADTARREAEPVIEAAEAAARVGPADSGSKAPDRSPGKPMSLAVLIRSYSSPDKPLRDEIMRQLVIELNAMLGVYGLYQDDRFLNVPFSSTTTYLISRGDDADIRVLNRLLIEDALSRYLQRRETFPPPERIEPERQSSYLYIREQEQGKPNLIPGQDGIGEAPRETLELRDKIADGALSAGSDPVHHLRLFANYLTPRKGALSADTWRAVSVVSRNLFLTWLILIPIFLAVVLMGQLYFLIHPSSASDFLHGETATAPPVAPAPQDTGDVRLYVRPGSSEATADDSGRVDLEHYRLYAKRRVAPTPAIDSAKLALGEHHAFKNRLLNRAASGLWLIVPMIGWIVVLIVAWMICGQDGSSKRQKVIPWIELGAAGALLLCMMLIFKHGVGTGLEQEQKTSIMEAVGWWWRHWYSLGFWCAMAVLMLYSACRTGIRHDAGDAKATLQWRREVRRNRLVRTHATLLVTVVVLTAVLAIAGYSHELVDFLFNDPDSAFLSYLKKIGGWGGLLAAVGSAVFTALKAAPTGGGDKSSSATPSALSKVIFAVAPTLFVLAGAIAASWAGQTMLAQLVIPIEQFNDLSEPLHYATFIGVILCFLFAWYEMKFSNSTASWGMLIICTVMASVPLYAASQKLILEYFTHDPNPGRTVEALLAPFRPSAMFAILIVALGAIILVVRFLLRRVTEITREGKRKGYNHHFVLTLSKRRRFHMHPTEIMVLITVLFAVVAALVYFVCGMELGNFIHYQDDKAPDLAAYAVFGLVLCSIYVVWDIFFGSGANKRTIAVITANFIVLTVFIAIGFASHGQHYQYLSHHHGVFRLQQDHYITDIHGAFCLMTTFLACAVALGWTVDPNMLSIHAFYKARLTRAYMGASNQARRVQQKEINEAVEGDDLPLTSLRNCQRGGPYHLINTTLNLVAGRDLATAQRSAANFILTQGYCGSARTGYRSTKHYLSGGFTLGSAVSVSGAAASPNMGSKTPTSSLAMLMTMFNVRLGYWAPTPNKESWQSPQARLWPFYTLRELLSQTNDLSSYCYLTDGGHFENTALYALVERGCRYIVLADCGADPRPCFSDLGDAIRRCRIDFGIEVDLNIIPVKVKPDGDGDERYGTQHFVVGRIRYSEAHARTLGWKQCETKESRTGYIIVVKPTLTQAESVDVRQYGFENDSFPQQSTADQWFDEAQFESYRRLGQLSVEQLLKSLRDGIDKRSAVAVVDGYPPEDALPPDATTPTEGKPDQTLYDLVGRLDSGGTIVSAEIPMFFREAFELLQVKENY
ncbi:MAG: hypothetical protein JWQ98_2740 [Chlorobi bacterium]|nr:hypothetical protein [Chlorobiota bacterium]